MNPTEESFTPHSATQYRLNDAPASLVAEPQPERRGFSLQLATTPQAVEALRPVWKPWTHSLETDIDYYLHKLQIDPTILKPYVITVWKNGEAQAMLVGLIRKRRISAVVSFVPIRGPKAAVLEIVHGGRMGSPEPILDRVLAGQLFEDRRHGDFDLLQFHRFALDSNLFREIRQRAGLLVQERAPHLFQYSVLPLTAPPGKKPRAFSGKIRREARRKTRILLRAFPGRVRYQCYLHPAELQAGLRDAEVVATGSWQRHLGDNALDEPMTRETLNFCARQGWLRVFVLYIDERPRAFLAGQLYSKAFYCQHAGFEPDLTRYSVGSLLTAWALEQLAAAGVEEVDLGEGGQEHNRRLGCRFYQEVTLHVYSPTLRGLWLNMFVASTQLVRVGGRKVRARFQLDGLKRSWSQLVTGRAKPKPELRSPVPENSQAA